MGAILFGWLAERLGRVRVQGEAAFGDKRIVEDALYVDRPGGDATYIRVARDVVHVVGRVGADHCGLEGREPLRRSETHQLRR